jgi:hypothetical protein
MIFRFKGFEGKIFGRTYPNRTPAWVWIATDGEPLGTITVSLENTIPLPGMILVKNYSENLGIIDALVEQKIVEDTGIRVDAGYATKGVAFAKPIFWPPPFR